MNEPESETAAGSGQNKGRTTEVADRAGSGGSAWRKWANVRLWPRRWLFWVLILLLAYTLGGFLGAPRLLERIATRQVAELDRTLSFGDIKVNPFLLTLQLKDAEMHDTDGVLLFSFDDYFFNFQASSLFRWAWTFKEIRLSGLQLNWERFAPGDDRFGRLIGSFPAEEEPTTEVTSKGLPRLIIQRFQLSDARVLVTDHLAHGKFDVPLGPINLEVVNLSTLPNDSGQQQANIRTRSGGEIAWQGSLQLSPLQSKGKVSVKGRLLSDLDHYLALFTSAKVTGEDLEWGFNYAVEQQADQRVSARIEGLHARFDGWKLFLLEDTEPFLEMPQLQISDASLHWPQQTLDIDGIEIQQARLNLSTAADGSLNLDRLLAEFAGDPAADAGDGVTASTGSETDWQAAIKRFSISQAAVRYRDFSTEPAAEIGLQDISVEVSDINNQPESSLPVQVSFALASGGTGQFSGQAIVLPEFSAQGQLQLDAVQLQVAQPWVNDIARVTLSVGSLNLNGQVAMSPQQPGSFQGSVAISGLDVNDNLHKEKLTGWKQLSMERVEVDLAANSVRTSELVLTEPYGRLQIAADSSTNLDGLMIETTNEEPTVSPPAETTALAITLAGFRIEDASLDFSDLTLPLPFAAAIRSMDGTISTLATQSEEPARVSLEGQVNEYSLARIGGSLNAWDPTGFTDIQMIFRNLEMERMTPYTIEFAGWEIDAGRMDLDLDYKIDQGQLKGENKVVIRELTVGDKVESPSGASLPLKFAVALLKDSDGVIDVDLPVEGDLNDPSFKIGGIVWKAIGNLLVKAVTAPFRLLGSLVGVDSEDFGTLQFSAGQAEISPPDREQLVKLAEAMRQRPELRLDVAGTYAVAIDKPALQTRQVDERIEQGVAGLPSDEDAIITTQRRQVMERMAAQSAVVVDPLALQQEFSRIPEGEDPEKATAVLDETAYLEALRQKLIDAEPVSDAALQALAQARSDAVVAQLGGDGSAGPLPLVQQAAVAVDVEDGGEVPMELKVEAGAE